MLRKTYALVMTIIAGSCATAQLAAAGSGGFLNLGANILVYAASADGAVASGQTPSQYFFWTQATGVVLIGSVGDSGQPTISDDGLRISGTRVNPDTGLNEIAFFDRGTGVWTNLGGIGGQSGSSVSSGWGMSGDGLSVVGLGWVNAGSAHAIRSDLVGPPVDLGSTAPERSTRANATNFDGSVVVGWQDGVTGFRQGAVWSDGVQTLIFDQNSGGELSEAIGVTADGQWVIGAGSFANGDQAYRWSAAAGVESLGHLDPTFRGAATGISDDGAVIVGFDRPFGPALLGQGFIWTESTGMVNLNTFAASLGIDTQGVTMSIPLGISADGRTIVGQGLGGGGARGFILTIPAFGTPADLNGDGVVNGADLAALLAQWGTDGAADLNGDRVVNGADLAALLAQWGTGSAANFNDESVANGAGLVRALANGG